MNDEKKICYTCVAEEYVSDHIRRVGRANRNCSYCGKRKKNVELSVIAEMLHNVFMENYEQSDNESYNYNYGDPAAEIIQDLLHIDEKPALDLLSTLSDEYDDYHGIDVFYSEDAVYYKVKHVYNMLGRAWEKMESSLKNESRYFNQHVKDFLDGLFSDIETLKINKSQNAIREINDEMVLYRARTFENYEDVEKALEHPERYFGPPPHELTPSGRMNARGIPVFYGASSPDIAVAEVRPVVGNFVVVVPFRPVRPLRILDISALNKLNIIPGSIFDKNVIERNEKLSFMRTLSRKLTLPVTGKNPEAEYLITQAVAEYLSVSETYRLDGISFKSTQHPSNKNQDEADQNVVLFRKSSKIKESDTNLCSYVVDLFEHIEDSDYVFYPTIRRIFDNKKISYKNFSVFSEIDKHVLEIIADKIIFYKINGVIYEKSATEIALLEPVYNKLSKSKQDLEPEF